MAVPSENALLSTQKSDSGLHVALHPLVLLTISDYITRHTLRNLKGPIIGALLGQQNGQELTVEHAFECKVDNDTIDVGWFETRLQQMKDVHKVPPLDLVGWYTLVPISGPQQHHLAIQNQLSTAYPESTILLGFHPTAVLEGSVGGKLPLTIYETSFELPESGGREDVEMEDTQPALRIMFKELPYTVETGQAEMISIDFVAKGGGNATAVETAQKNSSADKFKGKKRAADSEQEAELTIDEQSALTSEEEELIASLTAKANAIKMLQSRINLITTYLEQLPPSYITTGLPPTPDTVGEHTPVNHIILRAIQALLSRIALLVPADSAAFSQELLAEENDVNLVELLDTMTQSIQATKELGRKFMIVEGGRSISKKSAGFRRTFDPEGDPTASFDKKTGVFGVGDLMGR